MDIHLGAGGRIGSWHRPLLLGRRFDPEHVLHRRDDAATLRQHVGAERSAEVLLP